MFTESYNEKEQKEIITSFYDLFNSNVKSHGLWNEQNGKMYTKKQEYSKDNVEDHFTGMSGIGLVPIREDNTCVWGAIDIDNHSGDEIDINKISKKVHDLGIPLIPCRSKSGGVHCYLFTSESVPAHFMRMILSKWAFDIGHEGAEIFPKQSTLKGAQLGNWINIPYYKSLERLGTIFVNGEYKVLYLKEFIEYAKDIRVPLNILEDFLMIEHREAPPCIQEIIKHGIEEGYRNTGLYNITVYLRTAFPNDFKERAFTLNSTVFEKPLSFAEAKKTIQSASNKDYRYKCLEEPCRSKCDSETCLKREYGISPDDINYLARAEMPNITKIILYEMEPPLWEIFMDGTPVTVNTAQLYNYAEFAKAVMEKLLIVIPPMKNKDWTNFLAGLMEKVIKTVAPESASASGLIKERLREFLHKADLTNSGYDKEDREMIYRGIPVVQNLVFNGSEGRKVLFRGEDFISFLRRTKSEDLKGSYLWNCLRKFGVEHGRLRVNNRPLAVWGIPIDEFNRIKIDTDYLSDFVPSEEEEETGFDFEKGMDF